MPAIPVYIISGFLGSGKTTTILKLLDQKKSNESWAIVVNEFGKISVDGETLREKSLSGSVFDISGGCICCTSKLYLNNTLNKISDSGDFDRIIIEPTGLGGIGMVDEVIKQFPEFNSMPVVCMVDLVQAGNSRLVKNWIYRDQISRSELIFFSKSDLFSDSSLVADAIEKFKSEFPEKKYCYPNDIVSISFLDSFSEKLINGKRFSKAGREKAVLNKEKYHADFFSFGPELYFNINKIENFFQNNHLILRAKGYLNTPDGWYLFNYTLSDIIFKPCLPKAQSEFIIISETSNNTALTFDDIFHE